ncbi:hypothetical protein Bhyg_09638, partial [Pseudolycoriella hygida]
MSLLKSFVMDDAPFIGDWHLVKNLGAGGFGLVKLWQNSKTGQKIGNGIWATMMHYFLNLAVVPLNNM